MSGIIVPQYPQRVEFPELPPRDLDPLEAAIQMSQLCNRLFDEFGDAIDVCAEPEMIRAKLTTGTQSARQWAYYRVKEGLIVLQRQRKASYYIQLDEARLMAADSALAQYLHPTVQQTLACVKAEPNMPHELRIELRDAILAVQSLERQVERAETVNVEPRSSKPKRAQRASTSALRVAATAR